LAKYPRKRVGSREQGSREVGRESRGGAYRQSFNLPQLLSSLVLREPGAAALLQAVYPDVNHPDVPALDVMDYILTEGTQFSLPSFGGIGFSQ